VTSAKLEAVTAEYEARLASNQTASVGLNGGGGDGTSDAMETRVTRLEVRMENLDRSLLSIDAKLDKVNDRLVQLPTKADLNSWKLQWTGLALAVVAIIIGGIVGGLSWIQPEATPPAPTIIQMPSARS
jgi:hypothetical protein